MHVDALCARVYQDCIFLSRLNVLDCHLMICCVFTNQLYVLSRNVDRLFGITISHMLKVINFRLCINVVSI